MQPVIEFSLLKLIFLMGFFVAVSLAITLALARSKAGRWVLAFGGLGLLAFMALFGFYFLAAPRWDRTRFEATEDFTAARPPRAPLPPRVTLETERVSGESIVLAWSRTHA